jgi:two-component system, OmpR family, sensor histidine kinase RstB
LKSLYLRIYATLVVLLLAFAFGSAWLFNRQMNQERGGFEAAASERLTSMALLIHGALPGADTPRDQQAKALRDWGKRLRIPIALDDAGGERIATSEQFDRREYEPGVRIQRVALEDGRSLLMLRGLPAGPPRLNAEGANDAPQAGNGGPPPEGGVRLGPRREEPMWALGSFGPPRPSGEALVILLVLLFLAVAVSAYPVVRRLTRRLENLQRGVEQFGAGNLAHRVKDEGRDEVAALAASFNRTAGQIEALLRSHQSLLANASHELRSPLARLKMAFAMLDGSSPAQCARMQQEIDTNIAELDALVEEVLLASRLESGSQELQRDPVDLLGLSAEEASRTGALVDPDAALLDFKVLGEERLLRRALRNLLENARRYGGEQVLLELRQCGRQMELRVCDRGPGVPAEMRERIFEPFFRLPGHAEQAGGVGLGLSLVKQIAQRHKGEVRCESREGGGSCFVLSLPLP